MWVRVPPAAFPTYKTRPRPRERWNGASPQVDRRADGGRREIVAIDPAGAHRARPERNGGELSERPRCRRPSRVGHQPLDGPGVSPRKDSQLQRADLAFRDLRAQQHVHEHLFSQVASAEGANPSGKARSFRWYWTTSTATIEITVSRTFACCVLTATRYSPRSRAVTRRSGLRDSAAGR